MLQKMINTQDEEGCPQCRGNGKMPLTGMVCDTCKESGLMENSGDSTCEVCGKDKPESSMTADRGHAVCKECKSSGNYDFGNAVDQVKNAKCECMECGATFNKSNPTADTKCPNCDSSDVKKISNTQDIPGCLICSGSGIMPFTGQNCGCMKNDTNAGLDFGGDAYEKKDKDDEIGHTHDGHDTEDTVAK